MSAQYCQHGCFHGLGCLRCVDEHAGLLMAKGFLLGILTAAVLACVVALVVLS